MIASSEELEARKAQFTDVQKMLYNELEQTVFNLTNTGLFDDGLIEEVHEVLWVFADEFYNEHVEAEQQADEDYLAFNQIIEANGGEHGNTTN